MGADRNGEVALVSPVGRGRQGKGALRRRNPPFGGSYFAGLPAGRIAEAETALAGARSDLEARRRSVDAEI